MPSRTKFVRALVALPRRHPFALLFVALWLVYSLTASGYIILSDAATMTAFTKSLLHGHIDVPCSVSSAPGLGGACYSFYGPGWSLTAIPLYLLGSIVAARVHLAGPYDPALFMVSFLNPFLVAATAAILAKFVYSLSGSFRVAALSAVLFAVASPAWAFTKDGFSEPLVGFCLLAAAYVLTVAPPRPVGAFVAGSLLGLALLTRSDVLLAVVLITNYGIARHGTIRLRLNHAALIVPIILFGFVQLAYDDARFGSILATGYEHFGLGPGFQRTLSGTVDGLVQLLIDPTQGLLWFVPTLVAMAILFPAFFAKARPLAMLCVGLFLSAWIVHANLFNQWSAGWAWGPRYFMPILPFLFLPLAGLRWTRKPDIARVSVALAGAVGLVENLAPVLVRYERFYYADAFKLNPGRWPQVYLWRSAFQIMANLVSGHIPSGRLTDAQGAGVVSGATVLNEPDFWWFHLLHSHTLPLLVLVTLATSLVALVLCARTLIRLWSDRSPSGSVTRRDLRVHELELVAGAAGLGQETRAV